MNAHERYEELAVGHVLGGLDAADAAEFRSHLLGCRDCRLRVAELRDLAADLAAAEREERAEARVRTEVARRVVEGEDELDPAPVGTGFSIRRVAVGLVLFAVVIGLLAFWNLHLRTQANVYAQGLERSSETLRRLADGVPVTIEAIGRTTGVVVVDGEQVAFSFANLPTLADDERFVLWLLGTPDGAQPAAEARHDDQGALAGTIADEDATALVVTIEAGALGDAPAGREVVRAALVADAATG